METKFLKLRYNTSIHKDTRTEWIVIKAYSS